MTPIIDTHQHLWDLDKFHLPWLQEDSPLNRSFLMSDYLEAAEGLNVVKTIYMEVDLDPVQQAAEAQYVTDLCRHSDTPMAGAVIAGRPASIDFAAYITRRAQNPVIKGVRQVLHVESAPPGLCLRSSFKRGIHLLGELGLRFDLCMRPEELADAAALIDACPETRFVLDHCGNPPFPSDDLAAWRHDVTEIAKRPHVMCKVSGMVGSAKSDTWTAEDLAPIVETVAEAFGPDRLLFGSDWPVCTRTATYRRWVETLQQVVSGWSEEDRSKLFHDNAVRFYDLA